MLPKSSSISMTSHTSSPVPITHAARLTSSPRNPIPGNRRTRAASSVSDSTIALFERRVRFASASTSRCVERLNRMLNGSPLGSLAMRSDYYRTYGVASPYGSR